MTKLLERILGEDIALVTACQPGLPAIQADAGMMEQILLNLAVNSRDAMPHGGTLTIATSTETTEFQKDGGGGPRRKVSCVKLTVNDTGTGIDPGNLPHIFEPFFSTKEVGKGTGLGLATVHGIVLQHNGQITVSSDPGNGATFQIYFPALSGGKTKKGTAPLNKDFPLGWETLLVVEDENIVRIAVCGMLQRFGYKVLQAVSGRDALTVWTREKENIHLLLTDIVMPDGMTGFELASRLQGEKPALKIIYTSGYSGDLADKRVTLVEGVNFLQKPYAPRKLAQALRDNLDPEPVPPADVAGEADRSLPR
jgi:CheY-like chemotaxis protein